MIPKIIHQMGPGDKKDWHPIWEECHQSWKEQFPEPFYQHIFWTDDMLRDLVKNDYSEFLELYDDFPVDAFRIDFSRFCILHKYGGIYADLDFYCYENFYVEMDKERVNNIFLLESKKKWGGELVQNSLMASCKQNNFWILAMNESRERYYELVGPRKEMRGVEFIKSFSDDHEEFCTLVKNVTGPGLLNDISSYFEVDLFANSQYHPFDHYSFYRDGEEKSKSKFDELKYKYDVNSNIKCRHFLSGVWGEDIRILNKMKGV